MTNIDELIAIPFKLLEMLSGHALGGGTYRSDASTTLTPAQINDARSRGLYRPEFSGSFTTQQERGQRWTGTGTQGTASITRTGFAGSGVYAGSRGGVITVTGSPVTVTPGPSGQSPTPAGGTQQPVDPGGSHRRASGGAFHI